LTKKELWHICLANGIPPLLYKWSFTQDLEDGWLKRKLTPVFDDIDSFIRGRNVWYIYMEDSVLGSRVGATFFKAATLSNWSKVRYTTIENIAGYQIENWYENGDVYTNILTSDLVIVDKVKHKMEELQRKVWDKFVEDRLLLNKSTIFVGLVAPNRQGVFSDRAIDLLKDSGAKVLSEHGIAPIKTKEE
jgi:hypothetical protein